MSYIRYGHPLKYVNGFSEDYVYMSSDGMEDNGGLSNNGLAEILCKIIDKNFGTDDGRYFMEQVAEKLNVKLRKSPLTDKEYIKLDREQSNRIDREWNKECKKLGLIK